MTSQPLFYCLDLTEAHHVRMNIMSGAILPGGWHYFDKEKGYRVPHTSELPSPAAVVDAIMRYRLENNIPVGNPEADMEEYVCTSFPGWCRRGGNNEPKPAQQVQGVRNVDLVANWANGIYSQAGRLPLVPQKEAEERANICSNCPAQMDWSHDCPPCVTSAQRLLSIIRQGRDTVAAQDQYKLRGCSIYGWDNRTAVHIERDSLPPANPVAPPICWMRQNK